MQKTVRAVFLVIVATTSTIGQTAVDGEITGRIADSGAAASVDTQIQPLIDTAKPAIN
ncbi:MAG: hypothetical protein ABMA15_26310 [Vicinamibacterales bacterium]